MIISLSYRGYFSIVSVLLSLGTLSCFEDLDSASPCYNLSELNMPSNRPDSYRNAGVSLVEYKFSYLRDQARHCEINSGSNNESDACVSFYKEKLGLTEVNFEELYSSFPGIDCVSFSSIGDKDYGYCGVLNRSNSACTCLFNRDCQSNERCYAGRRYDIGCESAACTQCLPKDDPPPLK